MKRVVFWGTGNTAKKYINLIKGLSEQFEVVAFTDSNCTVGGDALWEGYKLVQPQMIPQLNIDYLCILTTIINEWEIRKKIYDENLFDLAKIISVHEIFMIDSWGMDIEACYRRMLKMIHPRQRDTNEMWTAYEYLKKNYSYVLCDARYWKIALNKKVYFEGNKKPIWILWLQGFQYAPELVKVCIHSIKRLLKEECICLLDQKNLFNYIDLPDYIIQKWKKGIITNTHFSDIIRVHLLNVYGGVWLDATVYFTGNKLLNYVRNSRLFMFRIQERGGNSYTAPQPAASWFIVAQPENPILMVLEALFNEYWRREDKMMNYYLFHIFMTMIVECFPEEWNQVEKIQRDSAQIMVQELSQKFDQVRFEQLKRISDVHKLSYKENYMEGGENSFWAKLCEIEEGWNEAV